MSQKFFVTRYKGLVKRSLVRLLKTTDCENVTRRRASLYLRSQADVQRLLLLCPSGIYAKNAPQPMKEGALRSSPPEPNAIAKISGTNLCENYNRQFGCDDRAIMPANFYGSHNNDLPPNAHVISALLRRFHEAVSAGVGESAIWGSGTPKRAFLHMDYMASASVFVVRFSAKAHRGITKEQLSHLKIGTGKDGTIRSLTETIAEVTGFSGNLVFGSAKPDDAPRKLRDVSAQNVRGWAPKIGLKEGLARSYKWFVSCQDELRL